MTHHRLRGSLLLLMTALTQQCIAAENAHRDVAVPGKPTASAIQVSDGIADCRKLHPYENAWLWTVATADGKVRTEGIWSDHLDNIEVEGRHLLRRVQGMSYVNARSYVGVTQFDARTCAPAMSEQHPVDGSINRHTVDGTHVVTQRTAKDGTITTAEVELPSSAFDFFNGQDGLLLAALPLTVGYSGTIAAINEMGDGDGPKVAPFKVVREELVSAGMRGAVHSFVVVSELPGEYTSTYWISEKPPYFIRLLVTYPDNRYSFYFDMI